MQLAAPKVSQYIAQLSPDRQAAITQLRQVILKNLPKGFAEDFNYGMITFVVPHSLYPAGYHCNPVLPLQFMAIASQKNYIALHHMGIYANADLLDWFVQQYEQRSSHKLDMGKGCIRFKKPEQIPLDLIGQLAAKITPQQWINTYETKFKR
ncbi:MAG: DUF1801 domain-containing protein [Sphingobacteriaceae bacterium]